MALNCSGIWNIPGSFSTNPEEKHVEAFEKAKLDTFFGRIVEQFPVPETPPASLLVTHLLAERPAFVNAVATQTQLAAVLPKPKSINEGARAEVEQFATVDSLTRELFADPVRAVAYLEERAAGRDVVLFDVGGYFASVLGTLATEFSGRILGVVEDTENGHQRYAELDNLPCPVFSVARSPLKNPEDYLVGQSVVHSTETVIRGRNEILAGREACVIGYGKLGRSIAHMLHSRAARVTVYDTNEARMVEAMAHGFRVTHCRDEALATANVIMCATGNLSLRQEDFGHVANGAYIASVTSSEDELELGGITDLYQRTPVTEHLTRYSTIGHYFYVLAGGNAVNFLHGAVVGPFIYLVQAEILAATARLVAGAEPGMHEVSVVDRNVIARTWRDYFNR